MFILSKIKKTGDMMYAPFSLKRPFVILFQKCRYVMIINFHFIVNMSLNNFLSLINDHNESWY